MADLDAARAALALLAAHDAASRDGFDTRGSVRAWTRTEARRRYHFDADLAAAQAALEDT